MDNIKTTKAYISAYLVKRIDDGKYYLVEQDYYSKEWKVFELDGDDIYGYKEWSCTLYTLKEAKHHIAKHFIL